MHLGNLNVTILCTLLGKCTLEKKVDSCALARLIALRRPEDVPSEIVYPDETSIKPGAIHYSRR